MLTYFLTVVYVIIVCDSKRAYWISVCFCYEFRFVRVPEGQAS
jgi:hypothetical protein